MGSVCGKHATVAPLPAGLVVPGLSPARSGSTPARSGPTPGLLVLWDVENLPVPRVKEAKDSLHGTAGDIGEIMLAHCQAASGGVQGAARLVCVHPDRYPLPLKNSLRTRGVQMLDAGPKRGAVDTHLKSYLNDLLLDSVLEGEGALGRGGWIWLASGDADFAGDMRRARKCGFKVGILYGVASNADYFSQADAAVKWEAVLDECAARAAGKRSSASASASSATPATAAPLEEGALLSPSRGTPREPCRSFLSKEGCSRRHCRYPHIGADGKEVPKERRGEERPAPQTV